MAEASSTEDVITLRIRFRSETVERFAERYAADLTPNEIFIRTREPLAVGTTLALEFSLNDGSSLISGRGSVAWTRGPEAAHQGPTGMGIRFETLNGGSRQMIGRIMEAKARISEAESAIAGFEPMQTPRAPRPAAVPLAPTPPARVPGAGRGLQPPPANQLGGGTRPENNNDKLPKASKGPNVPIKSAFIDEDAEPTELASLPPAFFYETGSDQEKTRLQNPRASAALLKQDLEQAEDDITNPRAKIPSVPPGLPGYTSGGRSPSPLDSGVQARGNQPSSTGTGRQLPEDLIATRETKVPNFGTAAAEPKLPTFAPPSAATQTDNHPLILSSHTATQPIPADVARSWRSPTPPATAAISTPPSTSFEPDDPDSGEVNWGAPRKSEPRPAIAPDPRWGGSLDTMATMPQLPPVMGIDPIGRSTPAWPAPAMDPHAHERGGAQEEARGSGGSSIRTWVALTLAAGGIVVAALMLLPTVLKSSAELAQAPPPAEPASSGTTVPAEPAAAAPGEDPNAARPAGEGASAPVMVPPTPVLPAAAPEVKPGETRAGEGSPQARPAETKSETKVAERPAARPARPGRNLRRPALAAAEDRPAGTPEGVEPAAAAVPPAPPPLQGEGSEEVYWLTIRSIPAGADVLIDGQVEGKTPFVRRIFDPTRSYALSIRRPGFEPLERTLGSSDIWTKRGNVRTLTVVAKLVPASGPPASEAVAPARIEPAAPTTGDPPPVAPPPVEPERKNNPFAEPSAPGGAPPTP